MSHEARRGPDFIEASRRVEPRVRNPAQFPERIEDVDAPGADLVGQIHDGGQARDQQICPAVRHGIALGRELIVVFPTRQGHMAKRHRQALRIARIGQIASRLTQADFRAQVADQAQSLLQADRRRLLHARRPRSIVQPSTHGWIAKPHLQQVGDRIVGLRIELPLHLRIVLRSEARRRPASLAPAVLHVVRKRIGAARDNVRILGAIPMRIEEA